MEKLQADLGKSKSETLYVGDDLNDIPVLPLVEIFVSPHNAVAEVRKCSQIVLRRRGGDGAVRELVDVILRSKYPNENRYISGWFDLNT